MLGVTEKLCKYLVEMQYDDLPSEVIREAKRSLVNIFAVGIGAANHKSMDIVLDLAAEIGAQRQFTVWGRKEKTDILFASLLNGMSSHIFDFDDTHLDIPTIPGSILHASAPIAPVVFALGEQKKMNGRDLILSFILGIEVECRVLAGISPGHMENGWHPTSTSGPLGAAAAAGKLFNMDVNHLAQSIGLAATQSGGIAEMLGTMSKPFHPGRAAMSGLMAAMLVRKGFTSSKQVLEAPRGFANVFSTKQDFDQMIQGFGEKYWILDNTYKPYACGVVAHPSIEGAIRLRNKCNLKAEQIQSIHCSVNEHVPVAMGKKNIKTGLEGKFSTYHCVAVALIDGTAGVAQYSDARVNDDEVKALREKVTLTVIPVIRKDEAIVEVKLKDGRVLKEHVDHAIGSSVENPMSDEDLSQKFREVASITLPHPKIERLLELIWEFDKLPNLDEVLANITP